MCCYAPILILSLILNLVAISGQQTILENSYYATHSAFFPTLRNETKMAQHILLESSFWETFVNEMLEKKSWKSSFPTDILTQNLQRDSQLYSDDTILKYRRKGAEMWRQNDTLWSIAVLGACKELAHGTTGTFVRELQKFKVIEALKDFVDHLHYFYRIATLMEARGLKVVVYGQNTSPIHDIDKLDPVMVVGYSERFEDNQTTSLWNACVDRHTHVNPHHQAHCLWHDCCHIQSQEECVDTGDTALKEMVCDKVSRRLQKNFHGNESDEMWDADLSFYDGLPAAWLKKATAMMHDLKHWKKTD